MYFHLYKYRQPVPGHQAGELRILVTFPGVRKPIKKAEKWTRCVCAPFCSPVSPGESKAGSNGSGQLSHCLRFRLLLVLCASNVHSYFVAGLNCFFVGGKYTGNAKVGTQTERCWWDKGSKLNKKWPTNRPCLSAHDPNDLPSLLRIFFPYQ